EHDDAVGTAADGAEPFVLRLIDKAIDDAVGAGEFEDALAAGPVEDFDARRPLQGIDVADLADAADGEVRAVRRECECPDATDGANALHAVPRVERGRIER